MTDLPPLDCAGCKKCCIGDLILLQPDELARFPERRRLPGGGWALAHGPHGSCIHLRRKGCGVHGKAPAMCQAFDCRTYYLQHELDAAGLQARLADPHLREVLLEGRRRVNAARAAALATSSGS